MSREKIDEMAKAMCGNGMSNGNCAIDDEPCELECVYGCCAERLYSKGYRKQIKAEWIISSDGYYPYCSRCKNEPKNGVMTDFCPNCGAYMKGEKNA